MKHSKILVVSLLSAGLCLALGTSMFATTGRPAFVPRTTASAITIDGNFSDWAGSEWVPLDQVYDGNPDDQPEGYAAWKWCPENNHFYSALAVRDIKHCFPSWYTDWAAHDGAEFYFHTTGPNIWYINDCTAAQQYVIGSNGAGGFWEMLGMNQTNSLLTMYPNPGWFRPVDASYDRQSAVVVDGDWIYYETTVCAYEYCGSQAIPMPQPSIISPLFAGMIVGLDVVNTSNDNTQDAGTWGIIGYRGMKCENNAGGKSANIAAIYTHTLVNTAGLRGTIVLKDLIASKVIGSKVTLDITQGTTTTSTVVTLGADGGFGLVTDLTGPATVRAKASHWLGQKVSVADIADEVVNFSLTNGDCDGDNEVTSTDLSILGLALGSTAGNPGFDATADLDGDGEVTSTDLSILGLALGTKGD